MKRVEPSSKTFLLEIIKIRSFLSLKVLKRWINAKFRLIRMIFIVTNDFRPVTPFHHSVEVTVHCTFLNDVFSNHFFFTHFPNRIHIFAIYNKMRELVMQHDKKKMKKIVRNQSHTSKRKEWAANCDRSRRRMMIASPLFITFFSLFLSWFQWSHDLSETRKKVF